MKIISVQRGSVREIAPGTRRAVDSAIDKQPVDAIDVVADGVVGDEIQNPDVHGGTGQAVYLYARTDYAHFEDELGAELPNGGFGENVTVDAWHTDQVRIGDRLAVGGATLEITGPRVPCQKFAARMTELVGPDAGDGWVKRFAASRRPGWYARVLDAGTLAPGDEAEVTPAPPSNIPGLELMDLYGADEVGDDVRARALASPVDPRIRAWLDSLG